MSPCRIKFCHFFPNSFPTGPSSSKQLLDRNLTLDHITTILQWPAIAWGWHLQSKQGLQGSLHLGPVLSTTTLHLGSVHSTTSRHYGFSWSGHVDWMDGIACGLCVCPPGSVSSVAHAKLYPFSWWINSALCRHMHCAHFPTAGGYLG